MEIFSNLYKNYTVGGIVKQHKPGELVLETKCYYDTKLIYILSFYTMFKFYDHDVSE